ncbi:hypothetical protein QTI51_09470 [Variovorax sp. J22G73]|uniref:hypothetical protein n=1 Tax=unclassified Variovorax TaxID=663243 RepID=UPI002575446C|nr:MULTISPECIES: hypothetical protein [unclassified Variovorax]MDM0006471.1 hypothetical protein [Variovorax sp. J22R203]MDM0097505.1 hypothetical protein [Variovorax sp. J22G73]
MADEMTNAITRVWTRYGRSPFNTEGTHLTDLHGAALLAAAMVGSVAREAGDFPVTAWAEANRLAQDDSSLINTSPAAPARKQ